MPDERQRILELLREGKITVEEADDLLDALGPAWERAGAGGEPSGGARSPRLCVRITDLETGAVKTNVRLPAGAWGLVKKLARTNLGRHFAGMALHDLQRAARAGAPGHLIDVTNDERGERVEIFFD